jgi:hypothetical protein
MKAIQFETLINDGTIKIPEQYLDENPMEVIVTLLPVNKRPKPKSIDEFPAILDTGNWKFNREEANAR